jgi:hypothetical protein
VPPCSPGRASPRRASAPARAGPLRRRRHPPATLRRKLRPQRSGGSTAPRRRRRALRASPCGGHVLLRLGSTRTRRAAAHAGGRTTRCGAPASRLRLLAQPERARERISAPQFGVTAHVRAQR